MQACQQTTSVSKVKVEEFGRKAVFKNPSNDAFIKTRFDGCVVQNQLGADWIVSQANVGDVIIELKGRAVEHAIKQVTATAEYLGNNGLRKGALAGLIVCRQYPSASSTAQRAQMAFSRSYNGRLHVCCANKEHDFKSLLGVS